MKQFTTHARRTIKAGQGVSPGDETGHGLQTQVQADLKAARSGQQSPETTALIHLCVFDSSAAVGCDT